MGLLVSKMKRDIKVKALSLASGLGSPLAKVIWVLEAAVEVAMDLGLDEMEEPRLT